VPLDSYPQIMWSDGQRSNTGGSRCAVLSQASVWPWENGQFGHHIIAYLPEESTHA
jgi:hypothetical protein